VRKLVQGHTWGPRALAWLSGVFLLAITLLCGWTGLVMVWDAQGQRLAIAGAKLMDLLPFLSLPLGRAFDGSAPVPSSFFFMNLFLHVALPLGVATVVWVHLSRLSRPKLLPPRRLWVGALVLLAAVAAWAPAGIGAAADLSALPGRAPLDLFYAFWLPAVEQLAPWAGAALWLLGFAALCSAPWVWRPRRAIGTSSVDEGHCTGCTTCYLDCPYEAIAMVKRSDFSVQRSELVARVDPSRCVGCGICSASCAPMGVGPAGRTGRDQLAWTRDVAAAAGRREVWVLACRTGMDPGLSLPDGVALEGVNCGGAVHAAVIERLLRDSAAGVLLVTCPPRNCSFREGPKWAQARLFEGREADLSPRVDRRRVRLVGLAGGDTRGLMREIAAFRASLATLETRPEGDFDLTALCERAADQPMEEMANASPV
jgi:Pyruvate/2-oxoacid:ferredoxin oxidoreductase delta subunit/coenzyme F420-reducing hydrogenase delta subunit